MSKRIAVKRLIEIMTLTRKLLPQYDRYLLKEGSSETRSYINWMNKSTIQNISFDLIDHSQLPTDIVENDLTTHMCMEKAKKHINSLLPKNDFS